MVALYLGHGHQAQGRKVGGNGVVVQVVRGRGVAELGDAHADDLGLCQGGVAALEYLQGGQAVDDEPGGGLRGGWQLGLLQQVVKGAGVAGFDLNGSQVGPQGVEVLGRQQAVFVGVASEVVVGGCGLVGQGGGDGLPVGWQGLRGGPFEAFFVSVDEQGLGHAPVAPAV